MNIMIIYHAADLDGKCSAAIVAYHHASEPNVKFTWVPVNYGDMLPTAEDLEAQDLVYMVDFSAQPWSEMARFCAHPGFVWIDHHKSAIQAAGDTVIPGLRRDGTAACQLTWEYLIGSKVPKVVGHLAAYDVWNHKDPATVSIQNAVNLTLGASDPANFTSAWGALFHASGASIRDLEALGIVITRDRKARDAELMKSNSFVVHFAGKCWICSNVGHGSKTFESVYNPEQHDGCMTFKVRSATRCTMSLYSDKPEVDCSAIASRFGGGGHNGAAGFTILLQDLHGILNGLH